ncbi:hypothetical protein [Arthrobacter sp. NA-172]|uniref:hypothetical protein n=1 Tax=Arthrobacter sp. NA-172 TaxID=3367524 RepID=UPI003753F684
MGDGDAGWVVAPDDDVGEGVDCRGAVGDAVGEGTGVDCVEVAVDAVGEGAGAAIAVVAERSKTAAPHMAVSAR